MTLAALPRSLLRHPYRTAFGIALVLGLAGIFQHSLWTPDEPREAQIGSEMLASGWSSMPTLGGAPFLEKPPLHPWIMAFFYRLFGVSEGVARLPALLAGIGSVLIAAALARRVAGRSAAVYAAAVLATMLGFADISHKAVNDGLLCFFVAAAHLLILERRALPLAGLCCGLAFLTKGPIGPILSLGPPLVAGALLRDWRALRAIPWCVLGTLALGAPWVLSLGLEHGWDKVRVCLIDNTIGRGLGGEGGRPTGFGHANGPLYYLGAFPLMAAPWVLALPALLRSRARFLGLLALAGVLLLSLPSGKREIYVLPLLPAAAAVVGVWLARARPGMTLRAIALVYVLVTAVGAWFVLGGPLGAKAAEAHAQLGGDLARFSPPFLIAVLAFGAIAFRPRAASLVAAVAAFTFTAQLALRPMIDPLKNMRAGVEQLSASIPAGEQLFGYDLDETTLAVVPFYCGRILHDLRPARDPLAELVRNRSRHLVLLEKRRKQLPAELADLFDAEQRVELVPGRVLLVYRLREER